MAVSSSSGRRAVLRTPWKNFANGRVRRPCAALSSSTAASSASKGGDMSAAAEASQTFPPTVARLRMSGPANATHMGRMRPSIAPPGRHSSSRAKVKPAPIRTLPLFSDIGVNSSSPVRSTTRSASSGARFRFTRILVPPATGTTRPLCASASSASGMSAGRVNSKSLIMYCVQRSKRKPVPGSAGGA